MSPSETPGCSSAAYTQFFRRFPLPIPTVVHAAEKIGKPVWRVAKLVVFLPQRSAIHTDRALQIAILCFDYLVEFSSPGFLCLKLKSPVAMVFGFRLDFIRDDLPDEFIRRRLRILRRLQGRTESTQNAKHKSAQYYRFECHVYLTNCLRSPVAGLPLQKVWRRTFPTTSLNEKDKFRQGRQDPESKESSSFRCSRVSVSTVAKRRCVSSRMQ
jgi:hypothetical protein